MKEKILIPTDMTKAADYAVSQAIVIAKKAGFSLVLFHVLDNSQTDTGNAEIHLNNQAQKIKEEHGVNVEVLITNGSIFDVIPFESLNNEYTLVVIATHGIRGLRQKLFGADILRLVSKIPVPTLVIQEEAELISAFKKILLPVSSHETFIHTLDATILLATLFQSEVILYSIFKPGFEWPEQLMKNIEKAISEFDREGIKMTRIKEDQNVYSIGYSKQILNFAKSAGTDLICMIPQPSKEYYYFAQPDKELLLLNDLRLPILCAGGKSTD